MCVKHKRKDFRGVSWHRSCMVTQYQRLEPVATHEEPLAQTPGSADGVVCPFCRVPIRSDAALRGSCQVGGMGIQGKASYILSVGPDVLAFCSRRCLDVYVRDVAPASTYRDVIRRS